MRTRALFAAVIIAAGLAADCGSPARPHAGVPAEGVVPWADQPAVPYAEPGPRTFPTDARPARPAEPRTSPRRTPPAPSTTQPARRAPSPRPPRLPPAAPARPGVDFPYTGPLPNPPAKASPLMPCPAYEEYVYAITGPGTTAARDDHVARNYYLNCDTVRQIRAHSSVAYHMRLQLPPGLPAGVPAKFVWLLHGPAGPGPSSPLRIGT